MDMNMKDHERLHFEFDCYLHSLLFTFHSTLNSRIRIRIVLVSRKKVVMSYHSSPVHKSRCECETINRPKSEHDTAIPHPYSGQNFWMFPE